MDQGSQDPVGHLPLDAEFERARMNKVIGFQITAMDEGKLLDFYANSFGWKLSPGPHEHVTNLETGNPDLDGSIIGRGDFIPDYVSLFIESDDIEATIETCCENGATLVRPRFDLDNGDQLAIIEDPEGHVITLLRKNVS
jgi:hypothetical protein